jgi:DNA polymerase III delta prime subunit
MHSYLICGTDDDKIKSKVDSIQKSIDAKIIEFKIEKIEHVRELSSITKLKIKNKTIILIKFIDKATNEALNAFLKNLEEPNPSIIFILTASSIFKVLPTISSRCQIINLQTVNKLKSDKKVNIDKFLILNTSNKLTFINSMKKKQDAIDFMQNLIIVSHQKLIEEKVNNKELVNILKNSQRTYTNLNANGNVNLQLTDFVLSLQTN